MKIEYVKRLIGWKDVYDAAMVTLKSPKNFINKEPTSYWKFHILKAEHSPINVLTYSWKWVDIPYWVSMELRTHRIGIPQDEYQHWIRSQRKEKMRGKLPQDAPVNHIVQANAQALINVSKKRLCYRPSKQAQEAWQMVLTALQPLEPELVKCCVPMCVYRGFCPEGDKTCGNSQNKNFKLTLNDYRFGGLHQ